jgi:EmrB/QacA subfamily drug resistance transporter
MILAVSMTFIDQTIVAIASPDLQKGLDLTSSQGAWVINAYLVALAATFALGGRLADVWGRRRMVVIGVLGFAATSILCAVTPAESWAATWLIGSRALQGMFAALLMPAAVSIVYSSAPVGRRGRTMAMFFGLTGAFTALGPLVGGHLVEQSWRSIFWINVPVAVAAIALARIRESRTPGRIDWTGAGLVAGGMAASVVGFAQSSTWGWDSLATWGCLALGLALLTLFVVVERRTAVPLIRLSVFRDRAFSTDSGVLFFAMIAFIPVSYFLSVYAQTSLGQTPVQTSQLMLCFFAGYFVAAQVGGRVFDSRGARPTMLLGCLVGVAGFVWWASQVTVLTANAQLLPMAVAGAGLGMLIGPVSADAVGRAVDSSYGEVTGVNQTVRNYGSALGLAVLGTLATHVFANSFTASLVSHGVPAASAARIAQQASTGAGGTAGLSELPEAMRSVVRTAAAQDFALGMRVVLLAMAGALAVAFVIALRHPGDRPPAGAPAPEVAAERVTAAV